MMAERKAPGIEDAITESRRLEYNRAVRDANLASLVLSDVKFHVDRTVELGEDPPELGYAGRVSNFGYDEESGNCLIEVTWSVDIKQEEAILAECQVSYHMAYDGFSQVDAEVVRLVAENLARPATYAYFRALYASLDWAAQLGTPPLPIMKFMPRLFGSKQTTAPSEKKTSTRRAKQVKSPESS
jgi:hypothetical protein